MTLGGKRFGLTHSEPAPLPRARSRTAGGVDPPDQPTPRSPSSNPATYSPWLRKVASIASAPPFLGLARGSVLLNGRFLIERPLGSGGMGIVYQAWDRQAKQRVAIKTLSQVYPASVYRLKLEFRTLVDVLHPNLVEMHGLFEDAGRWCLVMELLDGETLADAIERRPSVVWIREMFAQIALGISAIHAAGRLHRDLKPANVMVTPEGRAVIMDFGLASEQGLGVPGQTLVDGQTFGTPGYLAPEQAAGRLVTPESDWYAFGVMLYESLTAQLPVAGTTREALLPQPPRRMSSPAAEAPVPEDLERLCSALLERQPEMRATETEVRQVLRVSRNPHSRSSGWATIAPVERELHALHDAYRLIDDEHVVVMWLRGPRGSGKTTLARRFLAEVRHREDAVVLAGRCDPRESLPFRALDGVVDALSRHLRSLTAKEAQYLLPRHMEALCSLFPALGRIDGVLPDRRRRPAPSKAPARGFGVAAFKELLCRLSAHRPLVVFVDDVQFGDADSARLLAQLVSPPDPPELLFVGSVRTGSNEVESATATAFAAALAMVPGLIIRELWLSPLHAADAALSRIRQAR